MMRGRILRTSLVLATALLAAAGQEKRWRDPFTMRDAFSIARRSASGWDGGAFFVGTSFQPASEEIFKSGKRRQWEFQFATRSKCPPGQIRTMTVTVSGEMQALAAAKSLIDGFAVTAGGDTPMDPPLPGDADDTFMDAAAALRAYEKHGAKTAQDHGTLEIDGDQGGTVWIARIAKDRVVLDGRSGALIYRGKDFGKAEILEHFARKMSFKELDDVLRRDIGKWGKDATADIKILAVEGRALSADAFMKGGQFEAAALEIIIGKPEPRWFQVEVVNERLYWPKPKLTPADDRARFENVKELAPKSIDSDKLHVALAAHEKAAAWVAAGKGSVSFKMVNGKTLGITFSDGKRDNLLLNYKIDSDTLE